MDEPRPLAKARKGDVVAIHGHHLGEAERLGEILEVLGRPDHVHFRVRWDDNHESLFYPGSDATIRPHTTKRVNR
jgi:rRNA processing protein Gar1